MQEGRRGGVRQSILSGALCKDGLKLAEGGLVSVVASAGDRGQAATMI